MTHGFSLWLPDALAGGTRAGAALVFSREARPYFVTPDFDPDISTNINLLLLISRPRHLPVDNVS
jgi:hypothetical protein